MHYIIDNFIKSINDLFYQKLFTKVIDALRLIYEDKFDKLDINLTLGLIEFFFGGDMYDIKSVSKIVIDDDNTISISGEVTFEGQGGLYHPRKVVSFKNI